MLTPEPRFDPPKKVDKIVGYITLALASTLILGTIYWQLSLHFGWWPY